MVKIKGLNNKLKGLEQEVEKLDIGVELTIELDEKYMILVEKCEYLEEQYLLVELLEKDEQGFHSILVNSNTMELE